MPDHRARPLDFLSGLWLPFRGFGLVATDGALLLLGLVPVVLTIIATFGAGAAVVQWGDALLWARPDPAAVTGLLSTVWAWLGVAAWWVGKLTVLLLAALVGLVLARIVSAPVMDVLARKALLRLGVKAPPGVSAFGDLPLVQGIRLSIVRVAGRGLILFAGVAVLFALSFIPGAAVVTTPLGAAWTALWLFVDTTLYALQWVGDATLGDVRRLARQRPWASVGFAVSSGFLLAVPLVGFLLTPAAVAGACLLVNDVEGSRSPPPLPVPA